MSQSPSIREKSFGCIKLFCAVIATICISFTLAGGAEAAKRKKITEKHSHMKGPILRGRTIGVYERSPPTSLVVDVKTGKILESSNGKKEIYPASLTKLMTVYVAFEAIESGKLDMEESIPVSSRAANVIPLKLGLRAGDTIRVRDALNGTVIHSANDAAVALAERIGGSEEKFALLMTQRARSLGMKDTEFRDAVGFHHPRQKTTPIDLAKLAMALERDFPNYYHLFKEGSFEFKGRTIRDHSKVAGRYEGIHLIKTGYTDPAGCNLITTVKRNNKHLIALVTGTANSSVRAHKMIKLLDKHFGTNTLSSKAGTAKVRLIKHKLIKEKALKKKAKANKLKSASA